MIESVHQELKSMTRIAVIGSGISGLSTSYLLSKNQNFHVDLFEKEPRLGGHTHTHELDIKGDTVPVSYTHLTLPTICSV